jgi:hypothetical protein
VLVDLSCGRKQIGCHAGALSGNERVVDVFLRFGLDINSASPLCAATTVAMAQFLLDRGADPNVGCPLAEAARCGRMAVARVLLRHGADPNSLDGGGYAPLHRAVRRESVYAHTAHGTRAHMRWLTCDRQTGGW